MKKVAKKIITITKMTHSKIDFVNSIPWFSVDAGFVRLLGAEKKGVLDVVLTTVLLGAIVELVELKLEIAEEARAARSTSFIIELRWRY